MVKVEERTCKFAGWFGSFHCSGDCSECPGYKGDNKIVCINQYRRNHKRSGLGLIQKVKATLKEACKGYMYCWNMIYSAMHLIQYLQENEIPEVGIKVWEDGIIYVRLSPVRSEKTGEFIGYSYYSPANETVMEPVE